MFAVILFISRIEIFREKFLATKIMIIAATELKTSFKSEECRVIPNEGRVRRHNHNSSCPHVRIAEP